MFFSELRSYIRDQVKLVDDITVLNLLYMIQNGKPLIILEIDFFIVLFYSLIVIVIVLFDLFISKQYFLSTALDDVEDGAGGWFEASECIRMLCPRDVCNIETSLPSVRESEAIAE